jgi:hypothetical protein
MNEAMKSWIASGLLNSMVARFFLVQYTKAGKNIPNDHKMTKCHEIYPIVPNDRKVEQHFPFQGPLKYIRIGVFGPKQSIWQPSITVSP